MSTKPTSSNIINTYYEVHYGRKPMKDRKSATFSNEDDANQFFLDKDELGFHVDAFKITTHTITNVEKLTD